MVLTTSQIEANLAAYEYERRDTARYASFDYCFNYFRSFHEERRLAEILSSELLQLSCLHLGFYLASWGMFRGKSHLLQGSMKHYVPLLEVIASSYDLFDIDVSDYDADVIAVLRQRFDDVRRAFQHQATPTLVTKTMLGVFGCVPAFDRYFRIGFGASTFGPKSLHCIKAFFDRNAEVIERHRIRTLAFASGRDTDRRYTAAKVIDMIFFIEGRKKGLAV